jgi:low affinity Fe/Cu permease
MNNFRFSFIARRIAVLAGRPVVFLAALAAIVLWALSGPLFGFSDTWQLIVNTSTTIITFLMVFIIQNTQNRDTEALQIKIDELIRANRGAENALLDLESLPQNSLDEFRDHYSRLAEHARAKGFDLGAVIASMEAEKKAQRTPRQDGKPGRKTRKRKLSLAVKGT